MIRITILITILTTILILNTTISSNAENLYLCIDDTLEEVIMMDTDGQCIDGEREVIFEQMKDTDVVPVGKFSDNENCDTGGKKVELGFDKNGNNTLDDSELLTTSRFCQSSEE